jgi:hypothetical protein
MLPRISSNAVTFHSILEDIWIHETSENFLRYRMLVMPNTYLIKPMLKTYMFFHREDRENSTLFFPRHNP